MVKYINVENYCENICRCAKDKCDKEKCPIHTAPEADVVEVKHGRWEYDKNGHDWGIGAWRCSLCHCKNDNLGAGENINPYWYAGSKYCPHCGAKMDGGVNND